MSAEPHTTCILGEPSASSSSKSKKRKSKSRKSKKSKPSGRDYLPDPYTLSSQECCDQMGVTNVDFPYTEDDYENITSAKVWMEHFAFSKPQDVLHELSRALLFHASMEPKHGLVQLLLNSVELLWSR